MGKRPKLDVTAPKFGAWLMKLRGDRSLESIAIKVRKSVEQTGLKVSRSLIHRIESGRVPSWPLLFAFSSVYGVSLGEMLTRLVDALEFPGSKNMRATDLFSAALPSDGVQQSVSGSPHQEGGARYDSASPRQLAEELKSIARAFIHAIDKLIGDGQTAPPPKAVRPHRPRPPHRVRGARKLG